jgi:hypothetical protein
MTNNVNPILQARFGGAAAVAAVAGEQAAEAEQPIEIASAVEPPETAETEKHE